MCKVMMLTNATKIKNLQQVINKSAELITKSDDDGFGWLAQGKNGNFGERTTLTNKFRTRLGKPRLFNKLKSLPFIELTYEFIGQESNINGGIMLHGRTSTNNVTLENTHPITKNGWSVIHNGVVSNTGETYTQATTNDTEHIAHYLSINGIKGVEDNLSGYYAVGAFNNDNEMHIIKDSIASLVMTYSSTIDSYIYATTDDLITSLCKQYKWQFEPIAKVKNNVHLVYRNNNIIHYAPINPIGMKSQYEQDKMSTSLHYLKHDDEDMKWNSRELDTTNWNRGIETIYAQDELMSDIGLLEEIDEMAKYYNIIDGTDKDLTYHEFSKLRPEEKLDCIFIDPISGHYVDVIDDYKKTKEKKVG